MSYDIKLLELLNNQLELNFKKIMSNYIPFIRKLIFNELSVGYTKEDIEKYLDDVFWEVLTYEYGINSQGSFNNVLSGIVARRKVIDMHRISKNNSKSLIDDVSVDLYTKSYDLVRSIFLKKSNSQLIDDIKYLYESDSESITRKYSLNQRLRDISKHTSLKVSAYV